MEKLRAELGVDLVLEHLTAQDRQVILSLRDGASTPNKQVEKGLTPQAPPLAFGTIDSE